MNAIFNPKKLPVEKLPVIFGYNAGGRAGWDNGRLIAEDGVRLGEHYCSSEEYMKGDLGILEGFGMDKHRDFQKHYPDGYRMEFVSYEDVMTHERLQDAIQKEKI
jgi:hypothetical protein